MDFVLPLLEVLEPPAIVEGGQQAWFNRRGELHRDYDLPAYIDLVGTRHWYQHGEHGRPSGGPHIVHANGKQEWYAPHPGRPHLSWYRYRVVGSDGRQELYDEDGMLHTDNDQPAVSEPDGTQMWYRHGKFHRDGGLPAQIDVGGEQAWWVNGVQHRDDDLPAHIYEDGTQEWWLHGKVARADDKPTAIKPDGTQEWWGNGRMYRPGDRPTRVRPDGTQEWFSSEVGLHRTGDKPALLHPNGDRAYYRRGQLHRDNGKPAVIRAGQPAQYWEYGMPYHPAFGQQRSGGTKGGSW